MTLDRDRPTLMTYLALGQLGYALNGLGPILPDLQRELLLSRAQVAAYPSLFALGLIVVGFVGPRLVARLGRGMAFRLATAAFGAAAAGIALAPGRTTTSIAAALLGLSGAVILILVNATLPDIHGIRSSAAMAEANAVSSGAAVLAPLLIAAGIAGGVGWRIGFAAIPMGAAVALATNRHRLPDGQPSTTRLPAGKVRRWVGVVLAVAIEFAFIFWASDFLQTESGVDPAAAAAATSAFLIGMAGSRSLGGRLGTWLAHTEKASLTSLAICALGFFMLWSSAWSGSTVGGFAGLLIAGGGMGHLYPLAMSSLALSAGGATDLAAARGALASGVAIGVTPLILGGLADGIGLRTALLMIPALIVAAGIEVLTRRSATGHNQVGVPGPNQYDRPSDS